jgi:hypothetical protein
VAEGGSSQQRRRQQQQQQQVKQHKVKQNIPNNPHAAAKSTTIPQCMQCMQHQCTDRTCHAALSHLRSQERTRPTEKKSVNTRHASPVPLPLLRVPPRAQRHCVRTKPTKATSCTPATTPLHPSMASWPPCPPCPSRASWVETRRKTHVPSCLNPIP